LFGWGALGPLPQTSLPEKINDRLRLRPAVLLAKRLHPPSPSRRHPSRLHLPA
jgi:hypothetical protein